MSSLKSMTCSVGITWVWLTATGLGFFLLQAEHARPGRSGTPPARWPAGIPVRLDPIKPTLLIFLHPRCPCSRASVEELDSVAARLGGRFAAHAIVYRPEGPSEGWDREGIDDVSIPGIRPWTDFGGKLGQRFGVETSGHILLFDPTGELRFSGGITPSRGHRGENLGLIGLIARIEGERAGPERSPVFGCPTINPGSGSRGEEIR